MSVQTYRALISLYTEFCLLSRENHFSPDFTKLPASAGLVFSSQTDFFSGFRNGISASFQKKYASAANKALGSYPNTGMSYEGLINILNM